MQTCLPNQCAVSKLGVPNWAKQWINLKKAYHSHTGTFPRSMIKLLGALDLKFEGRQHSGIDDTRNIASAIRALALKGYVYEYTSKANYTK